MQVLFDGNASKIIQSEKVALIDNDFPGLLYYDEDILKGTVGLFSEKRIYLHPFTEFEFLRDVFTSEVRALKEKFVAQPIFGHISQESHMKVFPKLLENALLLSKIFAHQAKKGNKNTSSFVDLILAGLLMFLKDKAILIMGNKKDFPSCVFDTLSVLNAEQEDGSMRAICIMEFNRNKFDACQKQLSKVQ